MVYKQNEGTIPFFLPADKHSGLMVMQRIGQLNSKLQNYNTVIMV